MKDIQRYLVGTYTEPVLFGTGEIMHGKGKGIHFLTLDREHGTLSMEGVSGGVRNPSYIACAGDFVYCVNELKEYEGMYGGSVSVLAWTERRKRLSVQQVLPTHGEDPCHVAIDGEGRRLLVSNFMSGSVCAFRIGTDGFLKETDFVQHHGSGADAMRQAGPHAHSGIWMRGTHQVLVPDLGQDRLVAYQMEESGKMTLLEETSVQCGAGNGPRYGEFNQDQSVLYVVNELSSSVTVLRYCREKNRFRFIQELSTLPEGADVPNTAADIHISPDGKHVYASNRGHDSIAVFAVQEDGRLESVGCIPSGGRTPRNFAVDPCGAYVLAANQDSDEIALFRRDERTGWLQWLQTVAAPSPVCLTRCPDCEDL